MKRTRLRLRWADIAATLLFCALLAGFLLWIGYQVPDSTLSAVHGALGGQS